MFDVSQIAKRYFDIRLTAEDSDGTMHPLELKLEPPTIKQLSQLMSVAKADAANAIDELQNSVLALLRKNKDRRAVPPEYVDGLDLDQLTAILNAYLEWVARQKKIKN